MNNEDIVKNAYHSTDCSTLIVINIAGWRLDEVNEVLSTMYLILPAVLGPWGSLSLLPKWVPETNNECV
jgi:hypothetical protein